MNRDRRRAPADHALEPDASLRLHAVPNRADELERRAGCSNLNAFHDGKRVLRTLLTGRASPHPELVSPTAPIDLVEHVVATGLFYRVVSEVQHELAA